MFDAQTRFSNQQTIAAAAGTIVSTNIIDTNLTSAQGTDNLGNAILSDPGRSGIELECVVTEAVTAGGGAATVEFQLCSSANSDGSSPTVLQTTGAISKATLVAGYKPRLAMPAGIAQRYLLMRYLVATNTTDTGKVTAGLVDIRNTNVAL